MIYLLVTLHIQRRRTPEWSQNYEKHVLPILTKHGQKLVGSWKTTIGVYDEVTNLYAFENYGEMERIKTGIIGLDTIIEGGLPKNSITLISGPPGGGKSILCFQFLYEGVKNGDKCLFLTLDKKVESILVQARELGFDFHLAIEKNLVKFQFLNINKKFVYEAMTNEILSGDYNRVVLDSITPLSEMPIYMRDTGETGIDTSMINADALGDRKGHNLFGF